MIVNSLEQLVDLRVGADRNAEAVAVTRVVHVPYQNLACLEFLVERLHRPIVAAGPHEIRLAAA